MRRLRRVRARLSISLAKAGIPALYVTGEANGGGHAWIIMECEDGTWYHVDPTWDDGENTVSRAYFMQNDSVFGRTHKIRPAVPGASYPSCTGIPTISLQSGASP